MHLDRCDVEKDKHFIIRNWLMTLIRSKFREVSECKRLQPAASELHEMVRLSLAGSLRLVPMHSLTLTRHVSFFPHSHLLE
jgi:hypothetical protein